MRKEAITLLVTAMTSLPALARDAREELPTTCQLAATRMPPSDGLATQWIRRSNTAKWRASEPLARAPGRSQAQKAKHPWPRPAPRGINPGGRHKASEKVGSPW